MAANTSPIFGLTAKLAEVAIDNAAGTTKQTVYTPGTDGGVLTHINVTTDDTADVDMEVYINDGSTSYLIGTVTVTTLAGTDGTEPAVDLVDATMIPIFSEGYLFLPSGYTVEVAPSAAVTSAKYAYVVGVGVDY
jgi:hypothetical protein